MSKFNLPILCLALFLTSVFAEQPLTQQQLKKIAKQLEVKYEVIDNISNKNCDDVFINNECFTAQLTYATGSQMLPKQVNIVFSHISPIRWYQSDHQIALTHINGDLHKLVPEQGWNANTTIEIDIQAPFWYASRSDVMPNHYVFVEGLEPEIILSTSRTTDPHTLLTYSPHAQRWNLPQQYKRSESDNLAHMNAEYNFQQNQIVPPKLLITDSIRPIPNVSNRVDSSQSVEFNALRIADDSKKLLSSALEQIELFGLTQSADGMDLVVNIVPEQLESRDEYHLSILDTQITITAGSRIGANYALLTLFQLWDEDKSSAPVTQIKDKPRFEFRGLHLDIARHFLGKQAVLTVLEQMFQYKLNKLHLHLSDDEGWRLEIPELPELTDIGAYRCHDLSESKCLLPQLGSGPHKSALGNGFLSIKDYQDIITQADEYGIEVIPSFDMPGHSRAAVVAMNARYKRLLADGKKEEAERYLLIDLNDTTEYSSVQFYSDNTMNPCMESTYQFLDKVLSEVKAMHHRVGVPLETYHLGADETAGAWKQSPVCEKIGLKPETLLGHFIQRVVAMGNDKGITMAGWSDGIEKSIAHLEGANVYTNVWDPLFWQGAEKVNHFLEKNIPVVLSLPDVTYFDFPYANHPQEPGYYWASKATDSKKVFQFMPENLSRHSEIWLDRNGNSYEDKTPVLERQSLMGIQAQLWSETVVNQETMEYMLFPRLLAFAERAWHQADWQQVYSKQNLDSDWISFKDAMVFRQFQMLSKQNINFRVPPPGAKIENGVLTMNSAHSELLLEFSSDAETWTRYQHPTAVNKRQFVRTRVTGTDKTSPIFEIEL